MKYFNIYSIIYSELLFNDFRMIVQWFYIRGDELLYQFFNL